MPNNKPIEISNDILAMYDGQEDQCKGFDAAFNTVMSPTARSRRGAGGRRIKAWTA